MARYEGSPADEAEDKRGMKETGLSRKAYENSARDRAEDKAGEDRIAVKPHHRSKPQRRAPKAPVPGQFEFSPQEETAMRNARGAAPTPQAPQGLPTDGMDEEGI